MDPQAFHRVPPEVWTLMFDILSNEKDYNSLYNCYKTGIIAWNLILEKERTKFLFPLVVTNISTYQSTNHLIRLRLCCSTWKTAVDAHLLNSSSTWSTLPPSTPHLRNVHEPEDEWFRNSPPTNIGATFSLPSQIDSFLLQFSNIPPTQNPFPTRTVKLIENEQVHNSPQQNLQLYQKFGKLLKKFGDHIFKCIYYCDGEIPAANLGILNILKYAPNLKCLTIKKSYFWGEDDNEIDESLNWLKLPLPLLPQLKSLNLFLDSKQLANSFLFWYGKQLISLQIELDAIENIPFFNEPPILKNSLQNLRALKIIGFHGDSSLLDRLSKFDLPHLQRLSLNYNEVGRRALNFKAVFRLINKVGLTLEELRMPFNLFGLKEEEMIRCYQQDENMCLSLDKVKWLAVPYDYLEYPNLFQVILQKFSSLEHLHFMDYDKYYKDKQVERRELEENLRPFWGQLGLGSLKKITVENERTLIMIYWSTGKNSSYYYNPSLVDYGRDNSYLSDNSDDLD